jgi:hypothetical protein
MPFDPTKPVENSPLDAGEVRNQFNGLKAIIDAGNVPVGCVLAHLKSFPATPALPSSWVECNGQVLNDVASPYHGATLPNLNGAGGGPQYFLRGASASGDAGGSETHTHLYNVTDGGENMPGTGGNFSFSTGDQRTTEPASSLPTYYEVVWVMRVK